MDLPRDLAVEELHPGQPDLDRRLASALERAGHALRVLTWTQATAGGLSPIQLQLLLRIGVEAPGRRRVGTLAAEFDLSAATVSEALSALRRKGLVERLPLEGDKRGHTLALTESGRATTEVVAGWAGPVTAHLSTVPDAEKAATLRLVLDLIAHLSRTGVLAVARTCLTCRFFDEDAHAGEVRPHHCAFLDSPLSDAQLHVDCAEHETAGEA